MKNLMIFLFFQFIFLCNAFNSIYPQTFCGIESFQGENDNPDSFRGGFYKPATSNIGGAPTNVGYFPILVVFVQFKNERGDSTTTDFERWPARKKPNYFNNVIDTTRRSQSDWWNSYNNYMVSDYWHEFSRGKLHVYGRAEFIILSRELESYTAIDTINREIYDTLKIRLGRRWLEYDRWKLLSDGVFAWQQDSLVDMIYTVFRQGRSFLFGGFSGGVASLGPCLGSSNNTYTVYNNDSGKVVKIFHSDGSGLPKYGSGVRIFADSSTIYSRQQFLDIATHEHGHYLFLFNHRPYSKMQGSGVSSWEFSLSPWELIKLGYIIPKYPNYNNPVNYLYDYSSRGQNGSDTNEIIQLPISNDSSEFFLITNRRKVSDWDRRMGGDTMANNIWQYLKDINQEYGKGVYIYHNKSGYQYLAGATSPNNDIDMECADGLWNWEGTGIYRTRIDNNQSEEVIKKLT